MGELSRITEKLNSLRALDQGCWYSGASEHRYSFHAPLSEHELFAFEQEFKVSLPSEYVEFLMHLGNGGAGPGYGLFSLARSAVEQREHEDSSLDRPFPLTEAVANALRDCRSEGDKPLHPFIETQRRLDGIIEICDLGCGSKYGLVLTGDQRGRVWSFGGPTYYRWTPASRDRSPISFLAWYEEWLDEALAPRVIEFWKEIATGEV
jgi:SMI1 / KNR4 family (SUKH-1)